jgi:uncharacterized protein with von Willebrand factor type A (vWA) domain
MPPRRTKKTLPKRVFEPLPKNTCWLDNDAYDRRVWGHLRAESPSLRELEVKGGNLLPRFGSLLQDIFCLLFKYNIKYHPEAAVLPSALLNQQFLRAVHQGAQYDFLREQTLLNEAHAGLSTLILGERLLELVREEKVLTRRDLRDLWDIQKQEELVGQKLDEYENSETIPQDQMSESGKKALQEAKERMVGEVQGAEALLRHKTWGDTIGAGVRTPPGQKLELGRRLAGNEKLKKLARMVGRMKLHALALRKKVFERSNEELLEIEQGDALHRLLPHELLSLHHPVLRKDFYRRFLDQELIQYSLRGVEEKGKGPMIVCLDGSSSMSGDKEIWSKAVTLTLLEIARKQRRLFRSICFSSAETPLQVLDMNPRDRYEVETKTVMDLAEYFPGGGTDFQKPLDAALECLRESRFKKGDIIFITDGECRVEPEWAERFREEKARLGFSLFSILIDMGPASLGTLKEFSDRISTIKQLTGEEAGDIFVRF